MYLYIYIYIHAQTVIVMHILPGFFSPSLETKIQRHEAISPTIASVFPTSRCRKIAFWRRREIGVFSRSTVWEPASGKLTFNQDLQ